MSTTRLAAGFILVGVWLVVTLILILMVGNEFGWWSFDCLGLTEGACE